MNAGLVHARLNILIIIVSTGKEEITNVSQSQNVEQYRLHILVNKKRRKGRGSPPVVTYVPQHG